MSHALLAAVMFFGAAEPSAGTSQRSKLVDHASSRPTFLALKTTFLPSGAKVYSSVPPNGRDGLSASIPFIRSIGAPPATGTTKRCERWPVSHVSQWRKKSLV